MNATSNTNLVRLQWDNPEHVGAVAKLHQTLLPESVLSKLGSYFLEHFYYSKLPKDNLLDVYLYKTDNVYVGFISCTNTPFTFMSEGFKKNFWSLLSVLTITVITNPLRLFYLLSKKEVVPLGGLQKQYQNSIGQFLSFGVLDPYRKKIDTFQNETIPNVLMNKVSTHFQEQNKKSFFLLVLKTNVVALRFYAKHNGTVLSSENSSASVIVQFSV